MQNALAQVVKFCTSDNSKNVFFPCKFKVVVDVAMVLVYLHMESEEYIIHHNVKATNVMLDAKFNA